MYKRILLAYDGTLPGRIALREGALLAKQCQAQVFLLSVIAQSPGMRLAEGAGGVGIQLDQNYRDILEDGISRLKRLGFAPQSHLAVGEPAREIGKYADQIGADLVVVGHSPQSALVRWWSGPAGAHLVDFIRCTLLISRNEIGDEEFAVSIARLSPAPTMEKPATATPESAPPPVEEPAEPVTPGRRRIRMVLFALVPIALLAVMLWYVLGGSVVSIDDATIEADTVGVATDVSGIVRRVLVHENEHVVAGQELFELDDRPFRYALERADAQVTTVQDQLLALKASYAEMQSQINQADTDIGYFRTESSRQQALLEAHVASASTRDAARRSLEDAQQRRASLQQQLVEIRANLNGRPDAPVESYPKYHDAAAQRDEAARELQHAVVRAPFAGAVTDVPATTAGRYLAASTTAFYLVATDHVWALGNPKETELTHVRAGQDTTVHVDIYPGAVWQGRVESISPATAQQFSLLPAQNSSGNWVKVVQRIPVRIRLDTEDRRLPPLAAGLSAEIDVDTGHARGWPRFLRFGHAAGMTSP